MGQGRDADEVLNAMTIPVQVESWMMFKIGGLPGKHHVRQKVILTHAEGGIKVAKTLAESQRIRDLPTRRRNHEFAFGL
jgi:hypothetical protein